MDRRDRVVAGGLALALAVIVAAMIAPALGPSAAPSASVSPSPTTAEYREGIVGRPTSANPLTARSDSERALVGLLFSGLLRLGPDDTLRPDLAHWWRAEDGGTSWLVRIADDAVWQDGEPVTAADVVFTVEALADPALGAPQGQSWSNVSVEAVDDKTVRFELPEPAGGFPWLLTQPIAPAHLLGTVPLEDLAADPFNDNPVGNGPFRLVERNDQRAILEAVKPTTAGPTAAGATPPPSRPLARLGSFELAFFPDSDALGAALASGKVDAAVGLGGSIAAGGSGDLRTLSYPGTTLTSVVLDLRPDHKELRDSKVRRALMAAIDRDGLISSAAGGTATRADSPVPPSSALFDATVSEPVAHDLKAAAKLLDDAGWTRQSSGKWIAPGAKKAYAMTLLAPSADVAPRLAATARAVAEDWTEFGIATKVEEVPFETLVERLHGGAFTAAVVDLGIGHDPDLYPLLASSQVVSDGLNVSGLQDAKLDKLLAAARSAVGDENRTAAYKTLQEYLAKGRYLLTLYFADLPFTLSERVEGPEPHQVASAGDRYWDVLRWRLASGR